MTMIKLKTLSFSNMFSYGKDNKIDLDKAKITQLTAPNGSGKSSIAMVIQEILFNKSIPSPLNRIKSLLKNKFLIILNIK